MPRLVRRRALSERISGMLNPMDFLLWVSEELETRDWDSKLAGTQLGLGLNFMLLLARANSGSSASSEDVFGDAQRSTWVGFLIDPLVWILIATSVINAFYTVTRVRKYRLFEANVEVKPSTPSARRVKVQQSPGSNSPLRYFADILAPETADSRAHPDKTQDVWELSVWDPLPISLRVFCFFSPGHVLIYLLFLPFAQMDPRPSVTVFNALVIQALLSAQLLFLSSSFSQQAKDQAVIQKEVMHEYDTKFVHPRLHPVVRDVGTWVSDRQLREGRGIIETGTPTTLIQRSFATHPNPNYLAHVDTKELEPLQVNHLKSRLFTPPSASGRYSDSFTPATNQRQSASRKSLPAGYTPAATSTASVGTSMGGTSNFGGNMGIYSHHNSPLKKATSLNDIHSQEPAQSPRNSRQMAAYEQGGFGHRTHASPFKGAENRRVTGSSISNSNNPFAPRPRIRNSYERSYERYPSRY